MAMLVLPIKRKWYEMILDGVKKEEYREISPYYASRFRNLFMFHDDRQIPLIPTGTDEHDIIFRNGYSATSPSFIARCTLDVKTGNPEWGAEKGKKYYVLTVHNIRFGSRIDKE